jgi:CheY-like chemotaxis protein
MQLGEKCQSYDLIPPARAIAKAVPLFLVWLRSNCELEQLSPRMLSMNTGHSVLIVDDDEIIRCSMAQILRFHGYEVSTAFDGLEALTQLRAAPPPCLILLDLNMPVMDGFTFRVEQQLDPALADVPVVLVSGAANLPEEAIRLGVVDYVQKPADPMELLGLATRYAHSSGAVRALHPSTCRSKVTGCNGLRYRAKPGPQF